MESLNTVKLNILKKFDILEISLIIIIGLLACFFGG